MSPVPPAWLTGRLLVAIGAGLAALAAGTIVDDRDVLGLVSWDGDWYRRIAEDGYGGVPEEAVRFFPLYPMAARALAPLLLGSESAALLVIANVAAFVALLLVRTLVREETGDETLARRSVWLVAIFPAAFVLAMAYAEALLLALAVAAFLLLRRRRWWGAAAAGFFAGLTRPTGVILAAPALVEVARGWRAAAARERVAMAAAVAAPIAGLGSYLAWVGARFDDPWLPLTVQDGELRGDLVDPGTRLWRAGADLLSFDGDRVVDGLHLPFAVAFIALVVVLVRRWPLSYALYAGGLLAVALAADNMNSLERYALNAFPIVLALATVTVTARRWVAPAVLAASGAGMVSLTALALLGEYVP